MEKLSEAIILAVSLSEKIRREAAEPIIVSFVKEAGIDGEISSTLEGSSAGVFAGICELTRMYLEAESENIETQKKLLDLIHKSVSDSLEKGEDNAWAKV